MNTKIYNIKTIDKARWNRLAIKNSNICQTYEWALATSALTHKFC